VFITSVDMCFASKPSDDIPVTLEIRPVVNGYPSSNETRAVHLGSRLGDDDAPADQVKTSATVVQHDPQTVTTFTLPAPVHLLPGKEYALSSARTADAYASTPQNSARRIIGSDAKVAKQPYAGSFFKSQNASTWTESPFEDLMFRINRAVWTASATAPQTGMLVARGVAPDRNTCSTALSSIRTKCSSRNKTSTDYTLDIKPINPTTDDLTGRLPPLHAASCRISGRSWRRARCCRATAATRRRTTSPGRTSSVHRRVDSDGEHRGRLVTLTTKVPTWRRSWT
jgi:hypothetical protein